MSPSQECHTRIEHRFADKRGWFEHSVANMTIFAVALLGNHSASVSFGDGRLKEQAERNEFPKAARKFALIGAAETVLVVPLTRQ